jgi:hypothetical protein
VTGRAATRCRTPGTALAHLDFDELGFAWLPEGDFVTHFASGVEPSRARVLFAVQQPLSASTLEDVMGPPAWKSFPSWYLVATADQAIPPDTERQFAARMGATTVEVAAGHLAMLSHAGEVVKLIDTAVEGVSWPAPRSAVRPPRARWAARSRAGRAASPPRPGPAGRSSRARPRRR